MLGLRILTVINAILIVIYSVGGYIIAPQFAEIFEGIDTELPLATMLVIESYMYWPIVLLAPIFVYFKYLSKRELPKARATVPWFATVPMFVFLLMFIPLMVYVMYLPIFEMEAAANA